MGNRVARAVSKHHRAARSDARACPSLLDVYFAPDLTCPKRLARFLMSLAYAVEVLSSQCVKLMFERTLLETVDSQVFGLSDEHVYKHLKLCHTAIVSAEPSDENFECKLMFLSANTNETPSCVVTLAQTLSGDKELCCALDDKKFTKKLLQACLHAASRLHKNVVASTPGVFCDFLFQSSGRNMCKLKKSLAAIEATKTSDLTDDPLALCTRLAAFLIEFAESQSHASNFPSDNVVKKFDTSIGDIVRKSKKALSKLCSPNKPTNEDYVDAVVTRAVMSLRLPFRVGTAATCRLTWHCGRVYLLR
ncbi:MAG: hypothetical protein MHM6MM_007252 [Cercozoa sp. M6MM]